jgi:alkanesulfonate monooxygenase SsuD/methylene tetrahydromethanopterin reductase-like flavin-dependent oxidoreductase (luciferase family)
VPGFAGGYLSFPPLIFEPKPVQRPIPLYLGSGAGRASLRRIARFGQGWTPIGLSADEVAAALPALRKLLDEEGRDDQIELELSLGHVDQTAESGDLLRRLEGLAAIGATSVSVDFGIRSSPVIDDAIAAMRHFADVVMAQAADL